MKRFLLIAVIRRKDNVFIARFHYFFILKMYDENKNYFDFRSLDSFKPAVLKDGTRFVSRKRIEAQELLMCIRHNDQNDFLKY